MVILSGRILIRVKRSPRCPNRLVAFQGNATEAVEKLEEAIAIGKEVLGPDHSHIGTNWNKLGDAQSKLVRTTKTKECFAAVDVSMASKTVPVSTTISLVVKAATLCPPICCCCISHHVCTCPCYSFCRTTTIKPKSRTSTLPASTKTPGAGSMLAICPTSGTTRRPR